MNYLLRGIGVLATVGTLSLLAFSLPSGGEARGDGGDDLMPRLTHQAWQQECASCHLAYSPALLPRASWRRMMGGLEQHFGENASLDPATQADILRFLEANAADSGRSRMGDKVMQRMDTNADAAAHHRNPLVREEARRGAARDLDTQVGGLGRQLRGVPPAGGKGRVRRGHGQDSEMKRRDAHPAG